MILFTSKDKKVFDAFCLVANESDSRDNITIPKVAKKLGISRQALNKQGYHSIDEIIDGLHHFVNQQSKPLILDFFAKANSEPSDFVSFFSDALLPILYTHRHYFHTLYGSIADPSWMKFVEETYGSIIEPHLDEVDKSINRKLLSKIFIRQVMAIIACWLADKEPEHPLDFRKKFAYLMNHSACNFLKASDKNTVL